MDASLDVLQPDRAAAGAGREGLAEGTFPHGPFLVGPDGGLHPTGAPALRFAWRGRRCALHLDGGRALLSAAVGAVPYTAESAADRPGVFAEIASLPASLPPEWRLRLLPDHALRLEARLELAAPVTAIALVAAMTGFALALDPYLDRLEAAGVAAGAWAGSGSAKT